MKRFIAILGLMLLNNSTISAATQDVSKDLRQNRGGNPVTIYNYAPYDIEYRIGGSLAMFHSLKRGENTVFKAGIFDTKVLITVAACTDRNKDGFCSTIATHMNPNYYNAQLIKSIQVKSAYDYRVICTDLTATSCIVK